MNDLSPSASGLSASSLLVMEFFSKVLRLLQSRWKPVVTVITFCTIVLFTLSTLNTGRAPRIEYGTYDGKATPENSGDSSKSILLSLVREEELSGMVSSIRQLQDRFNKNFHYDWLFISETNFTTEFRTKIQETFTSGNALFEQIPKEFWQYPDFVDQEKAAASREAMADLMYGTSESYRHMCRFYSGFFYHLDVLSDYRYYWRVEPNVKFKCDIPEDPFKVMHEGGYSYGFTMTMPDDPNTYKTLWPTIKNYIHERKPHMPLENLFDFVTDDNSKTFNNCCFWSNFEIGDLNFFRSDEYQDFFNYLDQTGNFFYERWGDAPVHSIAVSLFLPSNKVKHFPYTGYYHEPNQGCPTNEEVFTKLNCDCNPSKDWTFHHYSCSKKFYSVAGLSLP